MATPVRQPRLPRAWYSAAAAAFLATDPHRILGDLLANATATETTDEQRNAWLEELEWLRGALAGLGGFLCLEFEIPRMGHRADAIVLTNGVVVVLEFKSSPDPPRQDLTQVWDYALDLKNFHAASHTLPILPILVSPGGAAAATAPIFAADEVAEPLSLDPQGLRACLAALRQPPRPQINAQTWLAAPYHPTPTIIEAARALYAGHQVEEIASSEAGSEELRCTSDILQQLVRQAREQRQRIVCFVTGVPGAGKTLVGLNLATRPHADEDRAVFLSGNGPLVAVLRAALQWDADNRAHKRHRAGPPSRLSQEVKSFIQNVHNFRDEQLRTPTPPDEHVAIFDEAQRAWHRRKLANFMQRRKRVAGFNLSEPEALLGYMDRHPDWALTVCLVGGGQEINSGEAGIGNWIETICMPQFAAWTVYLPQTMTGAEYGAEAALLQLRQRANVNWDDALHLSVSVRSFRAENLSAFVQFLLELDLPRAQSEYARLRDRFPIALTRNLDTAKRWVRAHARASQRYGLLSTSKAMRLKPHAIDVRVETDPVDWFLRGPEDTRSSFYLEDAATEFQVQGLELDWACVSWDADLRHTGSGWTHHDFRGSRWNSIGNDWNQVYARNAYRVLLTRARQGMVIFVPPGDVADPTRNPAFYDPTFAYLESLGLPVLS